MKDLKVSVSVEDLGQCKKLLRVEVAAESVDEVHKQVINGFQKQASLPGFRPGKAPLHMVLKAHGSGIEKETKERLIGSAYRKAVSDQNLRPVVNPQIEEIDFARGKPLQFAATIEVMPPFDVPNYKGLKLKRDASGVSEADVQRAFKVLQERRATFNDVDREVQEGDIIVANYTGTIDGKPVTDVAPTATSLAQKENFWIKATPDAFLPGFSAQLIGAKKGDKRTVNVEFPADFPVKELASRKAVYDVDVVAVKEQALPEVNDAFAQAYGAEDMAALDKGIREDLQKELAMKQKRAVRDQIVDQLVGAVEFELPESVLMQETRNVVYGIVQENQNRGVSKDLINEKKDEIYGVASQTARTRVKSAFILGRIAEAEKIQATEQEVIQRVYAMAAQYDQKPEKIFKDLQSRGGIDEIREQIITSKVLDFVELNADIEETIAS